MLNQLRQLEDRLAKLAMSPGNKETESRLLEEIRATKLRLAECHQEFRAKQP